MTYIDNLVKLIKETELPEWVYIDNPSKEQQAMMSEVLANSTYIKCKSWKEMADMYITMCKGGFRELEDRFYSYRSIWSKAIVEIGDNDVKISSTRRVVRDFVFNGSDKELMNMLLDDKELCNTLKLQYEKEPSTNKLNYYDFVSNAVYNYRMYNLFFTQNVYADAMRAEIKLQDGGMLITYHDISKYNIPRELSKYNLNEVDKNEKNMGGMGVLLIEKPNLLRDCNLVQRKIDENRSSIFIDLGLPRAISEEYNVVLSIYEITRITRLLDLILIRFPEILDRKYLCEEIITNIMYHNFNRKVNIRVKIYEGLLVGFECLEED